MAPKSNFKLSPVPIGSSARQNSKTLSWLEENVLLASKPHKKLCSKWQLCSPSPNLQQGCSNIRPKPLYCPVHDTDGWSPDERQFLPEAARVSLTHSSIFMQTLWEHSRRKANKILTSTKKRTHVIEFRYMFHLYVMSLKKKNFGEWGDEHLSKNLQSGIHGQS